MSEPNMWSRHYPEVEHDDVTALCGWDPKCAEGYRVRLKLRRAEGGDWYERFDASLSDDAARTIGRQIIAAADRVEPPDLAAESSDRVRENDPRWILAAMLFRWHAATGGMNGEADLARYPQVAPIWLALGDLLMPHVAALFTQATEAATDG